MRSLADSGTGIGTDTDDVLVRSFDKPCSISHAVGADLTP
jgi:hypothetical protein